MELHKTSIVASLDWLRKNQKYYPDPMARNPTPTAGRRRKGIAIKRAEGDTAHAGKKGSYDRDLFQGPAGFPPMPPRMSDGAKAVWMEYAPLLGQDPELMSLLDGALFEDFCELRAQKLEIEHGMYDEAKKAKTRAARGAIMCEYQGVLDKMRLRESTLRNQLGMSPVARSGLKIGPVKVATAAAVTGDALEEAFMGAGEMRPV